MDACPIPALPPSAIIELEGLVDEYVTAMNEEPEARLPLWGGGSWEERARRILLQMDALILKGYGLPPWLERKLLDFFRGECRPVPFEFGDYFPADFAPKRFVYDEKHPEQLCEKVTGLDLGIDEADLIIASVAMAQNLVLVTNDTRAGMNRVKEAAEKVYREGLLPIQLRTENWLPTATS